jgi:single-strand DNA-binding protein
MAGINKVFLVGTVAFEPEFNAYPIKKGKQRGKTLQVCKVRFAVDGYNKEAETTWFTLSIIGVKEDWNLPHANEAYDYAAQWLEKGAKVYVEGTLRNYSFRGRDGSMRYGTEVQVKRVMRVDDQPVLDLQDPAPDFEWGNTPAPRAVSGYEEDSLPF